jgi:tetratricopeptide (TPR) repeat protein
MHIPGVGTVGTLPPARGSPGSVEGSRCHAASAVFLCPPPAIPDHELLKCIGHGSYGEVWLAHNVIGVYRAVKIVYRATFDSDRPYEREFEGLKRFEPVSRSHATQVALLHVGRSDPEGYFYHIMELADDQRTGQDIDPERYEPKTLRSELKARKRLPFDESVSIGLALTTALQHLHENGLIHRDIKPSNIIFINGRPKLADIGLVATVDATCSFVGTEGYVPPEGPGTPQADLYSLGKVLYELNTGQDRRDFPELPLQLDSAAEEKGLMEFNAVVVKACKLKPHDRYHSAADMHQDLLLLLAGKSVRRTHAMERRLALMTRIGVGAVAAMFLGAGPYYLAIREARQADAAAHEAEAARSLAVAAGKKAEIEAARSQQVAALLEEMLAGVGPSVALGRDTTLLREVLSKTVDRVGRSLTNQPEVEAELRNTIGEVYLALGRSDNAEIMHRAALKLRRGILGEEHVAVAESLHNLAKALINQGQLAEAEAAERRALAVQLSLLGEENTNVATTLNGLGNVLFRQGRRAEAETTYRQALDMRQKLLGPDHTSVAESLNGLAGVFSAQGKRAQAEAVYRQALAMLRKQPGNDHPDIITTLNYLGTVLNDQQQHAAAEKVYLEALAMAKRLLGDDHPLTTKSLSNLADTFQFQAKSSEMESLYREDLARATQRLGSGNPGLAAKLGRLAAALRVQGKDAEAGPLEDEALDIARKLGHSDPLAGEEIVWRVGAEFRRHKQYARAEPLCREALTAARECTTNAPARLEDRMAALAECLKCQARWSDAEPLYREALASARATATNDLPRLERRINELADVLDYQGKLPEAENLYREALALKRKRVGSEGRDVGLLLRGLAYVFQREGKLAEAETALRESLVISQKAAGNDNPHDATGALYGLAWILQTQGKLPEAETTASEALSLRLRLRLRPEDRLAVADSLYQLAVIRWSAHGPELAEQAARECVAAYECQIPAGWQTFNSRGTLAGILIEQRKYDEAEPLLLSAYGGLEGCERKFPAAVHPRLRETICRLVRLSEETSRPADAARWQQKLAEFDKLHSEAKLQLPSTNSLAPAVSKQELKGI